MLEKIQKFREYLDYVERHYLNVQKAWRMLNDKLKGRDFRFINDDFVWHQIDQDVKNHDASKLSAQEFTQYRQWFFPAEGEEKNKELFLEAWTHHKMVNAHHWQNWTLTADHLYADAYLVMMLVDWIAMSYEFGDTAKDYYEKNKAKINLPDWAVKVMYEVFDIIYD